LLILRYADGKILFRAPGVVASLLRVANQIDKNLKDLVSIHTNKRHRGEVDAGFVYTTDWDGTPVVRHRMHWVAAEATATAAVLHAVTREESYATWYQTFWDHIDFALRDREGGSWWHELDSANRPSATVWSGKPDTYHALQATLVPRLPVSAAAEVSAKSQARS